MQIVVVTRHLARAAFYYGPVLRALVDADTRLTLVGAAGTDVDIAERRGIATHEIAIRPQGLSPAPMEWAVLAGALHALEEGAPDGSGAVDVLMTLEEDLASTVVGAARAARARLVVTAADEAPTPGPLARVRAKASPLWDRVRRAGEARLAELPIESLREGGLDAIRSRLPRGFWDAGAQAAEGAANASRQLQGYLRSAPVHYLLRTEPGEDAAPPAGWTNFAFGAGLEVEAFLANGRGRDVEDVSSSQRRVGVFYDPFGDPIAHRALAREVERAANAQPDEGWVWVAPPALPDVPRASMNVWAQRYLQGLDVAVVPGTDFYAAMQAAAAGCLVITHAQGRARAVLRIGESGLEADALDATQLSMLLTSVARRGQLARMQDAAQRRAVRLFGSELLLRRLVRSMDDSLALEVADDASAPRVVRRHV